MSNYQGESVQLSQVQRLKSDLWEVNSEQFKINAKGVPVELECVFRSGIFSDILYNLKF